MITRIYNTLKSAGLNPYWPGKHQGECRERYCVVKAGSQVPFFNSNKTGYKLIDIIVYTPISSYTQLDPYIKEIKTALKDLPLRYAGETPVITDESKQAYTTSVQYQILKKLEG